jgi:hypothetical protein
MIFDAAEHFLSGDELLAARQDATLTLGVWRKRAIYATVALCLSCAAVVPFSKGEPLHAYAEPFGRLLVYLSMGGITATGYPVAVWSFYIFRGDVGDISTGEAPLDAVFGFVPGTTLEAAEKCGSRVGRGFIPGINAVKSLGL